MYFIKLGFYKIIISSDKELTLFYEFGSAKQQIRWGIILDVQGVNSNSSQVSQNQVAATSANSLSRFTADTGAKKEQPPLTLQCI